MTMKASSHLMTMPTLPKDSKAAAKNHSPANKRTQPPQPSKQSRKEIQPALS
jgi:hypothetical protein